MSGIGVTGAGAWGTALAFQLARANPSIPIYLWGNDVLKQQQMQQQRCNPFAFPQQHFPSNLLPAIDLTEILSQVDSILIAVPSHAFTSCIQQLFATPNFSLPILSATKGLEPTTAELLHTVVEQYGGEHYPYAVLSGPSFASEVMAQLPTAITIAAKNLQHANYWQDYLLSEYFRVYTTDDIIGVQLGGAIKNVLAIAAGISDGLGFGANARAALITRGLAEMLRLNETLGGICTTLTGLAGVGDLILTCTDSQSRNRRFGIALGEGKTVEAAQKAEQQVIEGSQTARLLYQLSQRHKVEMPICHAVYTVLHQQLPVRQAIQELLARAPKAEH